MATPASRRTPINSQDQLGNYRAVLSHDTNLDQDMFIELPESIRHRCAVLLQESERVRIITTEWPSAALFVVIGEVEKKGYTVTEHDFSLVTPHLFNLIIGQKEQTEGVHLDQSQVHEAQIRFRQLIEAAIMRKYPASDIHAEFNKKKGRILFRINGFREHHTDMLTSDAEVMFGAAWYGYAQDKAKNAGASFTPSKPQAANGSVTMHDGTIIDFRWQSKQADSGFDVVLRLLVRDSEKSKPIPLEKAGYEPEQLEMIISAANSKGGATFFSGDTGSGKSTSMLGFMKAIHAVRPMASLVSLENPREYLVDFIRQTSVTDGDFTEMLAVLLRSDYDSLMTGEVRTKQEVDGFVRSVLAGHQGCTTIHTADAQSILQRLEDIGVARSILGSKKFFSLIIHQTLVPTLCKNCRLPFVFSVEAKDARLRARMRDVGLDELKVFGHGNGCAVCESDLGINGRTVVAEVVRPTMTMKKLFTEGRYAEAFEVWEEQWKNHPVIGSPAIGHAVFKIGQGITSPFLVEYMAGNLNETEADAGKTLFDWRAIDPIEDAQAQFRKLYGEPPIPPAQAAKG